MTFNKGWLGEQIRTANDTIGSWAPTKREAMVREDLCPPASSRTGVKTSTRNQTEIKR